MLAGIHGVTITENEETRLIEIEEGAFGAVVEHLHEFYSSDVNKHNIRFLFVDMVSQPQRNYEEVQLIRGDRLRVSAVIDKQGEGFARRLDFEHFRKAFALCDAEVYILDMSFVKVREEEVVNFLNDEANKQRIRNLRELKGLPENVVRKIKIQLLYLKEMDLEGAGALLQPWLKQNEVRLLACGNSSNGGHYDIRVPELSNLLQSPNFQRVHALDASRSNFSRLHMIALLQAPNVRKLHELHLNDCRALVPDDLRQLVRDAQNGPAALSDLQLRALAHSYTDDRNFFARIFAPDPVRNAFTALAEATTFMCLKSLDVSRTLISDNFVKRLANNVKFPLLERLSLRSCQLLTFKTLVYLYRYTALTKL